MAVPATSGNLVTSLTGMKVGDYIVCNYTASSGAVGTFSNFGGTAGTEIPVVGSATPSGTFYFIKADKGLLIVDRVIQNTITWDTLNTAKVIQGNPTTLGAITGIIRSLSGGVTYADINGNYSTTDTSNGTFPTNNGWKTYIVNSNLSGKITAGDDNVWHWKNIRTWCQDTPSLGVVIDGVTSAATTRILRPKSDAVSVSSVSASISSGSVATSGFRPVFQYLE